MNPSHLKFGCKIDGNEAADVLAGAAAGEGRRQDYVNPDKSLDNLFINRRLRHEAAKLVHDIERMFPRDDESDKDDSDGNSLNGPTARPCAVPTVAASAVVVGKPGAVGGLAI